jgi:hypothetical protein
VPQEDGRWIVNIKAKLSRISVSFFQRMMGHAMGDSEFSNLLFKYTR